jgi:hypothetical protein
MSNFTYTLQFDASVTALGNGSALLAVQEHEATSGRLGHLFLVRQGVVAQATAVRQALRHFPPSFRRLSPNELID